MPDPAQVNAAVQYITRGVFQFITEEVAGQLRRRGQPQLRGVTRQLGPDGEALGEYRLEPLPPLGEDQRLGDSLAGPEEAAPGLPADLFAPVVGLTYETRVLRRVVESEPPLHALLIGPPGSAKSLLLEELARLPDSRYIVGRNMSPSGLLEMFLDSPEPPRLLLVDELEKSDPSTLSTLLVLMDGKATRAIHGKPAVVREVDVRVVGAGNSSRGLNPALLSRFIELPLPEYTTEERHRVIVGFLSTRHGLETEQAEKIATLVAPGSGDPRDAEQIARVMANDPELAEEMARRLGRNQPAAA